MPKREKKEKTAPAAKTSAGTDKTLQEKEKRLLKNYTGDAESERDYKPVRTSQEYKSGCLGGMMYLVFILCAAIVLASLTWMAASDALALNKENVSATITLPAEIFETVSEDVTDDDGNIVGVRDVSQADIDFVSSALKESGIIE